MDKFINRGVKNSIIKIPFKKSEQNFKKKTNNWHLKYYQMEAPKKPFYAKLNFMFLLFSLFFLLNLIGNIATGSLEVLSLFFVFGNIFISLFFTLCYFLIVVMDSNKAFKSKLEDYNKQILIIREDDQLKEKRKNKLFEIKKENENKIAELKKQFNLVEVDHFEQKLIFNQSRIEEKYIQNLVSLGFYLNSKRNSIKKQYDLIISFNSTQDEILYLNNKNYPDNKISIKEVVSNLNDQNMYLNSLTILSNQMLEALLNNDFISFYKIFNVFERLGVFNKEWENQLLKTMSNINDNLFGVMEEIRTLESSISSSLYELELEIFKKIGK